MLVGPGAPDGYWGELEAAEFDELLALVRREPDFDLAIVRYLRGHRRKDLYPYICDCTGRTSWLAFLPRPSGGVALDVGSGHGAIAEGLSGSFERVYALEGCHRRCELLVERTRKKDLRRIEVLHADAFAVPLEDASVDLVACNGTLEWVALTVPGRVGMVQRRFLAELRRVLKPGGVLYIGIENRFGRQYLRGAVDHTGVRYTSLLPRPLASLVSRRATPKEFAYGGAVPGYRTYTYGARGYRRLLRSAGFGSVGILCAEPSYDLPRYAFPYRHSRHELGAFFDTFVHRPFSPVRDRLLANNFFIFASPSRGPEPSRRPTFFGFAGTIEVEDGSVVRVDPSGSAQREPRIVGTPLLREPGRALTVEGVVAAYEVFMATAPPEVPPQEVRIHKPLRDFLAAEIVGRERLDDLLATIAREHLEPVYHGDFWVGNILRRASDGRLALIDRERHPFGSRKLDGADFLLDFLLNGRTRGFPAFDLVRFCSHFGIAPDERELLEVAILRQVLWYSPTGRAYPLLFTHLEMLRELCSSGRLPVRLRLGLSQAGLA
jgi:ubiquinone/menaquinone biosynthesis C-methylase UbiE